MREVESVNRVNLARQSVAVAKNMSGCLIEKAIIDALIRRRNMALAASQ